MTDNVEKKKSGCGKWLGCGCLVLVVIGAGLGVSAWYMARKMSTPSEAHAGHFIPDEASGWMQMNLQNPDEGLTDLHQFIMTEFQNQQPEEANQGLAGMVQNLFAPKPGGKPAPIGPKITGWTSPRQGHDHSSGALVIDLNSMNKITATALRFTFSSIMAAEATEISVDGVSLYENTNGFSFLSHKGFVVLSENVDTLKTAAKQFSANESKKWPSLDQYLNEQDIRLQWTQNFKDFNLFATDYLGIANPKDGDFKNPARGLNLIDLDADVVSADEIQFVLSAQTETVEDARRIQTDLEEHAGEMQQRLSAQGLSFTYAGAAAGKEANLTATLSGLKAWISGRIAQMFPEPVPAEPVSIDPAG